MALGKQRHKRKKRRQNRAALRDGRKAKPVHRGRSGRTGSMHTRKLRSRGE